MAVHNDIGSKGEDIAAGYLIKKGHYIIARNYRHEKAEVDIISTVAGHIVFTEVKTRSTDMYGYPEASVTAKKKAMLKAAMDHYLTENKIKEEPRFDIISIMATAQGIEVFHIEDAFFH